MKLRRSFQEKTGLVFGVAQDVVPECSRRAYFLLRDAANPSPTARVRKPPPRIQ